MAFGNLIKDAAGTPAPQTYEPGSGFVALKGSTNTNTDGSGNVSTAAALALDQSLILTGQLQNVQTGNANGTPLTMNGMGSVLFEVIMTGFTGTVNFEGAGANGNYDPLFANQFGTNTIATTVTGSTTTSTHLWELANASGLQTVRARTSSVSAGNVTVNAYALPFVVGPRVMNTNVITLPSNASVNVAQLNGVTTQMAGSDGVTAANMLLIAHALYNGATMDQQRGNLDNIIVLASGARTTTQTQTDQTNYNHRGIQVVLDMTTAGTGSVTLEIDAKDPVSGKYVALLTGAAVTSNSTNLYTVYPGVTVAANVSASQVLPRTWRIKVTANNANSATYSVGAMLMV